MVEPDPATGRRDPRRRGSAPLVGQPGHQRRHRAGGRGLPSVTRSPDRQASAAGRQPGPAPRSAGPPGPAAAPGRPAPSSSPRCSGRPRRRCSAGCCPAGPSGRPARRCPRSRALLGPASTTPARVSRARSNSTWAVEHRGWSAGGSDASALTTMTSCAWASDLPLMATKPARDSAVSSASASGSRSSACGEAIDRARAVPTFSAWVISSFSGTWSARPARASVTSSARAGSKASGRTATSRTTVPPAVADGGRDIGDHPARRVGHA